MELIDALMTHLSVADERRMLSVMDKLIERNQAVTKSTCPGFIYLGRSFRHTSMPRGKLIYPDLHESLHGDMKEWLFSESQVKEDLQRIRQSVAWLIAPCNSFQDIRDALPECLVFAVGSQLTSLERTREPAWSLDPDSRAMRQYLKILPKMEYFAAAKLIY